MDIPAGGSTKLAPKGLHIMLIGLHGAITEGDRVQLELVFEDGSATTIEAMARSAGGMMHKHHHH
jgi:copper(I)-binding protein